MILFLEIMSYLNEQDIFLNFDHHASVINDVAYCTFVDQSQVSQINATNVDLRTFCMLFISEIIQCLNEIILQQLQSASCAVPKYPGGS